MSTIEERNARRQAVHERNCLRVLTVLATSSIQRPLVYLRAKEIVRLLDGPGRLGVSTVQAVLADMHEAMTPKLVYRTRLPMVGGPYGWRITPDGRAWLASFGQTIQETR